MQGAGILASGSKTIRSTDIAEIRLVQKRTSRVPKHGPPGYASCDRGMIRQSFWSGCALTEKTRGRTSGRLWLCPGR